MTHGESEIDKINLDYIDKEVYRVGNLTTKINNLLGLTLGERKIVIWKDRIKYLEKHKTDFRSKEEYRKHVESIPEIISNPEYVGLHPTNGSIEYIKRIDEIMLVGVRIRNQGKLAIRSCFPITQDKLNEYIRQGTIKQVPKDS